MSFNFRSLQDRLRERLLAQIAAGELTGLQLARETGFQQAHISNFLNRKRGLSLEAMDMILDASGISLLELLPNEGSTRRRRSPGTRGCADFITVPVVEEQNCTATQVPNSGSVETVQIAAPMVQKLRPEMHIPRPHWQRFVAVKVKSSDAEAMYPRLTRGAIAVIDRHYNAVVPWKQELSMYLVQTGGYFQIRYVAAAGIDYVLRPHNAEQPLEILRPVSGKDPVTAIVGRICFVHQRL
jgi:transcriptional regulator with XRE-family HTH domain